MGLRKRLNLLRREEQSHNPRKYYDGYIKCSVCGKTGTLVKQDNTYVHTKCIGGKK